MKLPCFIFTRGSLQLPCQLGTTSITINRFHPSKLNVTITAFKISNKKRTQLLVSVSTFQILFTFSNSKENKKRKQRCLQMVNSIRELCTRYRISRLLKVCCYFLNCITSRYLSELVYASIKGFQLTLDIMQLTVTMNGVHKKITTN